MNESVSEQSAAKSTNTIKDDKYMHVTPSDMVLWGCGVITVGAVAGGIATYRAGEKSFIEDGINPSNRMRMIPVAVKTLMLSTLFTGVLGLGGFYALKSAGWFTKDTAEMLSAPETFRMLTAPKKYFTKALREDDADSA